MNNYEDPQSDIQQLVETNNIVPYTYDINRIYDSIQKVKNPRLLNFLSVFERMIKELIENTNIDRNRSDKYEFVKKIMFLMGVIKKYEIRTPKSLSYLSAMKIRYCLEGRSVNKLPLPLSIRNNFYKLSFDE